MEVVILWMGINGLIGYAIGKPKNEIGTCMALCILLGPIGWLISIFVGGNTAAAVPLSPARVCPFCAENIKAQAIVCPHCRRDLNPLPAPAPPEQPPKKLEPELPRDPSKPDPEDVKRVEEMLQRYEHPPHSVRQSSDEPYRI
jgi:hypothetical protein